MDGDMQIDVDEIRRNVNEYEVISLFFPYFRKTLLLDTRCSDADEPMVRVVPMVATPQERLESLERLRPRFGRPESMVLIPWPRFVASIKTLGIWQSVVDRLTVAGGPRFEVLLERCYRELLREERAELGRAITGEGYRALWQRSKV